MKKLLAQHWAIKGESADWLLDFWRLIIKDNLTCTIKFFWFLVRHRLSPTNDNNIIIWDRVVLVAALVAKIGDWLCETTDHGDPS